MCWLPPRADFVVIGGLAGIAHEVGWTTIDVDILIATEDPILVRLATPLAELEAIYYLPDRRRIEPDIRRLRSLPGPQLLETKFGRLDLLKEAGGETYESVLEDVVRVERGGYTLQVASLERLLVMKRAANRPKDRVGIERIEAALRKQSDEDR